MANSLRPVSTDVVSGMLIDIPTNDDFGPAPQLNWIKIADLVIDDRYQRDVMRRGARNGAVEVDEEGHRQNVAALLDEGLSIRQVAQRLGMTAGQVFSLSNRRGRT